jgi:hypothetical protein
VLTGTGGGQTIKDRISTMVNACANDIIKSLNIPFDKAVSDKVVELLQCRDESGALNCAYCLKMPATTEDHFLSLIRNKRPTGATNHAINMIPCCRTCNSSKGKKMLEDWRPILVAEPRFIAYLAFRKEYMSVHPTTFEYNEGVFLELVETHVKHMMVFSKSLLDECKPHLVYPIFPMRVQEEDISDIDAP